MSNLPLNIDLQQICLHLLNFTVLFAVLYFLLYSPVKKFMEQRTRHYKELEEQANATLAEAQDKKKEYDDKLMGADEEIEGKRQAAYRSMAEKTEAAIASAKRDADKIITDARKRAQDESKKMIEDARGEIAGMVADAAEKMFVNSSTSQSYDRFLTSVEDGVADD